MPKSRESAGMDNLRSLHESQGDDRPRSAALGAELTNLDRTLREQELFEERRRAEELARQGEIQRYD